MLPILRFLTICLLAASVVQAKHKVYVMLWFDTEDYIDPQADDAALRIADDLSHLGVRATFKVVGEKARVLEARGRQDVIAALSRHAIGYHTNYHSQQPVHAVYMDRFGLIDGAQEFVRREHTGIEAIRRVFGLTPICYGQPGSSWGPQAYAGLRQFGVPIYLDEGTQVGLRDQPFWYGGVLNIFNMGSNLLRPNFPDTSKNEAIWQQFVAAVDRLSENGGVISSYFHPTEFVNSKFWDAVNFSSGEVRPKEKYVAPPLYTKEEAERNFQVLTDFVKRAQKIPNVEFITAEDALRLYRSQTPAGVDKRTIAQHWSQSISFIEEGNITLSAAEAFVQLLGLDAHFVDGPVRAGKTTYTAGTIPDWLFDKATDDVRDFIQYERRLPSEVFVGADSLSLGDFVATFAAHLVNGGPVRVQHGKLDFQQYIATDAAKPFHWPIHPNNFEAPHVLELAALEAWTLKPARLK